MNRRTKELCKIGAATGFGFCGAMTVMDNMANSNHIMNGTTGTFTRFVGTWGVGVTVFTLVTTTTYRYMSFITEDQRYE